MSSVDEIIPVRSAHRFDEEALARYLTNKLEGFAGELTVKQFGQGQSNPTYLLGSGDREWVLRKKPPGKLLPSAHAVDREYRVIKALQDTDVPVPEACLLCEDDTVVGTPFYVMKRAEGRIFRNPSMPEVSSADERSAVFDAMNENLAKLHQVDWRALGLEDYGRSGNYMARQVDRWTRQYEASKTDEIESMEGLIRWLSKNIPDDETTTTVHGDYRLDNLLFATPAGGSPVAIVDWQTAEIGLPGRDLGYFLGNSLLPEDRRKHEQALVRSYHEALLDHDVAGYSLDECFDDYRYGQFQGPLITVLAAVGLTHTERGDDMFMAMSSRACQAIRDLESLELL